LKEEKNDRRIQNKQRTILKDANNFMDQFVN